MNLSIQTIGVRRSSMRMAIVVALHAVFLYALLSALHPPISPADEPRIDVSFPQVQVPPETRDVLPRDPPKLDPDIRIPVPIFKPIDTDDLLLTRVETKPGTSVDEGPGTTRIEPVLQGARVDPRNPLSQPPYPASQIRAGNEGSLTLELLIGIDGRVKDARVSRSSGFTMLDQAAVNEALRRWRMLPAMRGNTPVEKWTTMRVVFRLDQR